jgi:ABC-type polysaccharide/polyol phosphate export permease
MRILSIKKNSFAPPVTDINSKKELSLLAGWDLIEGFRLHEIWLRSSLNEISRRYRRTLLGPAWVTISLLIFASALSLVWAGLWNQKVSEFLPYLLSGLIPWTMMATSITESCATFLAGENLIKNRMFPYSILIYNVLTRNTIILSHNLAGFILVAVLCGVPVSFATLLIVPGAFLFILNCGWMCLLVAILCLRFRDFQQLVNSLIQIIMFITPVFWGVQQLNGDRLILANANLLYHLIELIRQPLLGKAPAILSYMVCIAFCLFGWYFTYKLYASKRHRLAYWF